MSRTQRQCLLWTGPCSQWGYRSIQGKEQEDRATTRGLAQRTRDSAEGRSWPLKSEVSVAASPILPTQNHIQPRASPVLCGIYKDQSSPLIIHHCTHMLSTCSRPQPSRAGLPSPPAAFPLVSDVPGLDCALFWGPGPKDAPQHHSKEPTKVPSTASAGDQAPGHPCTGRYQVRRCAGGSLLKRAQEFLRRKSWQRKTDCDWKTVTRLHSVFVTIFFLSVPAHGERLRNTQMIGTKSPSLDSVANGPGEDLTEWWPQAGYCSVLTSSSIKQASVGCYEDKWVNMFVKCFSTE